MQNRVDIHQHKNHSQMRVALVNNFGLVSYSGSTMVVEAAVFMRKVIADFRKLDRAGGLS